MDGPTPPPKDTSNPWSPSDHQNPNHIDNPNVTAVHAQENTPVQPHPNATADDTSHTLPHSTDNAAASTQHRAAEGYSGSNRVPTVAGYNEDRRRRQLESNQRHRDAEAPTDTQNSPSNDVPNHPSAQTKDPAKSDPAKEKEEMKKRMAPGKDRPNQFERKGERECVFGGFKCCW